MDYNEDMILWPFIFTALLWANEQSVEEYCFSSTIASQLAHQKLSNIALPADRITQNGQCLTVSTPAHRRELIQRYLHSVAPEFSIKFSSAEQRKEPCKLMVEKIKEDHEQSGHLNLHQTQVTTKKLNVSEQFQLQTLKDFELTVNQDSIIGECAFIHSDRYEITIKVRKDPPPLPPVPAGSIVVVQTPPADQEATLLQTQLQLVRGNRVEIGAVVRELKERAKTIDTAPRLKLHAQRQKVTEKVFLSLH